MPESIVRIHVDGIGFGELPRGGITRVWLNLLRCFGESPDCRVTLYLPRAVADRPELPSAINVVQYPRPLRLRPGRLFGPLCQRLNRTALEKMWSIPRDGVFHSTHFTTYKALRIPQVLTIHDLFHECLPGCFPEQQARPFVERRAKCVRQARSVVCDSHATRSDVFRTFAMEKVPARVVLLAVEPIFRSITDTHRIEACRQQFSDGRPFLLFVGTRYPYKNFAGLLAAYSEWPRRSEYRLVVVGGDPTFQERAMLKGWGLDDLVRFQAPVSDEDLVLAYNAAACVVVPALSEGFGIPVWEAMACGTPVVAARAGSLPEVGGETPIYFDHGPPSRLVAALEEAIQIPRTSPRIQDGIRRATRRTWNDVAAEYLEVYRAVLDAKCGQGTVAPC